MPGTLDHISLYAKAQVSNECICHYMPILHCLVHVLQGVPCFSYYVAWVKIVVYKTFWIHLNNVAFSATHQCHIGRQENWTSVLLQAVKYDQKYQVYQKLSQSDQMVEKGGSHIAGWWFESGGLLEVLKLRLRFSLVFTFIESLPVSELFHILFSRGLSNIVSPSQGVYLKQGQQINNRKSNNEN